MYNTKHIPLSKKIKITIKLLQNSLNLNSKQKRLNLSAVYKLLKADEIHFTLAMFNRY